MSKIFLGVLFSLLFVSGSFAQQVSETRTIAPFTELVVGDRIVVRLVKSNKESIGIQTQGVDASAVRTEVTGNVLTISVYGASFTRKKVIVTLGYVQLSSISVTGGADVTTTSLMKTNTLTVDLKSGGMLYLDADIEYLTGKLTEGAILSADGYATSVDITVSTSATYSAFELETENCKIKATSGGKAKINVTNELNAEASSRGYISYKGNPSKINQNATSGGTINIYAP